MLIFDRYYYSKWRCNVVQPTPLFITDDDLYDNLVEITYIFHICICVAFCQIAEFIILFNKDFITFV